MNGLNKKKNNRYIFVIVVSIYLVLMLLLNMLILNMPNIYKYKAEEYVTTVKRDILNILTDDTPDKSMQLDALAEEYKFELVVRNSTTTAYSTMPETIGIETNLMNIIDSEALSYQEEDIYKVNGTDFQVWMAIYKYSQQNFFEYILYIVVAGVVILCALIILLLIIMFRNLISPLVRLRDNIFKLKAYRLNEVSANAQTNEYDSISKELSNFSADLEGKITSFSVQYSQLEQELKTKQEIYKDKINLVRALIHDMKSPLSIEQMQIDYLRADLQANEQQLQRVELLQKSIDKLMDETVDVLKILDITTTIPKQEIDAVKMTKELLRVFLPLFKERHVTYDYTAPKSVALFMNPIEFKQIIHNILSNAAQYTEPQGTFELAFEEKEDALYITAYNDVVDSSNIDFTHVFDLFYYADNQDNKYSTGIGMFSIKHMAETNGGSCTFAAKGNGVLLEVRLPKNVGEQNEAN